MHGRFCNPQRMKLALTTHNKEDEMKISKLEKMLIQKVQKNDLTKDECNTILTAVSRLAEKTEEEIIEKGIGTIDELYMIKKNRDDRVKQLKKEGYTVYKSSSRNQQLHPMYVTDYPNHITESDKGLGNTIYKTVFAVVYHIHAYSKEQLGE